MFLFYLYLQANDDKEVSIKQENDTVSEESNVRPKSFQVISHKLYFKEDYSQGTVP